MNIEEVSEILKKEVLKNHPEISIIAIYGSAARDHQTEFSDLDMYAIVDNEDNKFEINFSLDGQTVEFWCISWKWAEKIASANDDYPLLYPIRTSILLNNKVIYVKSEEDRVRFNNLSNLAEIGEKKQIQIASKHFNKLFSLIGRLEYAKERYDLVTARWAIWDFIDVTVCVLGLLNDTKFMKNWGSNLHEAFKLDILPEFYEEDISILAISDDFDELISTGRRILRQLRIILNSERKNMLLDYDEHLKNLPDEYMGFKSYQNKILSACSKKDILAASYAATELQIWLAEHLDKTENKRFHNVYTFNTYQEVKETYEMLKLPDLSKSIAEMNFEKLKEDAEKMDKIVIEYLEKKDVKLQIFKDISQIREFAKTK
jgi:hypothetical protein